MCSNEREKTCSTSPLSLAINVIHFLLNKLTWFERLWSHLALDPVNIAIDSNKHWICWSSIAVVVTPTHGTTQTPAPRFWIFTNKGTTAVSVTTTYLAIASISGANHPSIHNFPKFFIGLCASVVLNYGHFSLHKYLRLTSLERGTAPSLNWRKENVIIKRGLLIYLFVLIICSRPALFDKINYFKRTFYAICQLIMLKVSGCVQADKLRVQVKYRKIQKISPSMYKPLQK